MSISQPYQQDEGKLVGQLLETGKSMREALEKEKPEYNKYTPFTITDLSTHHPDRQESQSKLEEQLKKEKELVWHTKNKSTPLPEMDLDFKIVAAIHTLKCANKAHSRLVKAEKDLSYFMDMLETFEANIAREHRIRLPSSVREMKNLREQLKQGNTYGGGGEYL